MRSSVTAGLAIGALVLSSIAPVGASGSSGPISWSDDVVGTTTRTGSVFGTRCGSGSANAAEESATLTLVDPWAASAVAANYTYLSPAITPANNTSGDNAVLTFPGTGGITVTVSRRQVPAASAADLADSGVGAFSPNARFRTGRRLQDCAPRSADLATAPSGMTLARTTQYSGIPATRESFWNATGIPAGNQMDAALFEFSEPIGAFGVWLGDMETRPPIAAAPGGGVLAVVKLLDSDGNLIASSAVLPDEAVTDDSVCGGTPSSADGLGCGSQSTRFIGFVQPAANVASMIVIVGDDDSCAQTGACDGISEYLSWMGPMMAAGQPDLAVTKSVIAPLPAAVGDPVSWAIDVTNVGSHAAAAGWTIADAADAGLAGLALSGAVAEVDCAATTSCTGLVPIPPGATITVTATGTHSAPVGTPIDNVAFASPAPGDRPELIPAGADPSPGDDTSATATNNDANAASLIAEDTSLQLIKYADGNDANTAPGAVVTPGSTITYTFEVTTSGNVAISTITLSDDNGTPGDAGDDFSPSFVGGDSNADGSLDPGETWLYQTTAVAGSSLITNTATANGTSILGTAVSASDLAITSPPAVTTTTSTSTVSTPTTSSVTTTSVTSTGPTSSTNTPTSAPTTTQQAVANPTLAVTGSESRDLAMAAIVLLMAGLILVGAGRVATMVRERD